MVFNIVIRRRLRWVTIFMFITIVIGVTYLQISGEKTWQNLSNLDRVNSLKTSIGWRVRRGSREWTQTEKALFVPKVSKPMAALSELIIVPCHGLFNPIARLSINSTTAESTKYGDVDADWYNLPHFLKGHTKTLVKHIEAGCRIARENPQALVVFSGGSTNPNTVLSEGDGYWLLAQARDILPSFAKNQIPDGELTREAELDDSNHSNHNHAWYRAVSEVYALDSFQNLLFSVERYREVTGRQFPDKITIVGYEFKQHRFVNVHAPAVFDHYGLKIEDDGSYQFNAQDGKLVYQGIDPEAIASDDPMMANRTVWSTNEYNNALKWFMSDPWGNQSPTLVNKRRHRNRWTKVNAYRIKS